LGIARLNETITNLITEAQRIGPKDPFTIVAYGFNATIRLILSPLNLIIVPPFTFILGILAAVTFGVLLMVLSVVWLPLMGLILGSSWLWIKAPITRPFLLLPGVVVAVVADVYVSLIPDMGEKYQKLLKMGLCDSWPYSYLVFQLNLSKEQPE